MSNTTTTSDPAIPAGEIDALVLGLAPATAVATLFASLAQSTGILFENAVQTQKLQTLVGSILVLEALGNSLPHPIQPAPPVDPDAGLADLLAALNRIRPSPPA